MEVIYIENVSEAIQDNYWKRNCTHFRLVSNYKMIPNIKSEGIFKYFFIVECFCPLLYFLEVQCLKPKEF